MLTMKKMMLAHTKGVDADCGLSGCKLKSAKNAPLHPEPKERQEYKAAAPDHPYNFFGIIKKVVMSVPSSPTSMCPLSLYKLIAHNFFMLQFLFFLVTQPLKLQPENMLSPERIKIATRKKFRYF